MDDHQNVTGLVDLLDQADAGLNRFAVVLYSKHSDREERRDGFDVTLVLHELVRLIEQAAAWRGFVRTVRACLSPHDPLEIG